MSRERLYEIDILRFLAAFFVVLFHYTVSVKHAYHFNLFDSEAINTTFSYGNLGVMLFFLISGFVILMSARNATPKSFLRSRALRLYPSFIPLCIITWVVGTMLVAGYDVSFKKFLLNLTLVGTLFTDKYVSGVYWTLRVEIQFYIFILFILLLNKISNIRVFLNAWLIISIITHFGLEYFDFHRIFNISRYIFITDNSYYFIAGCYFYLLRFERKSGDLLLPLVCWLCSVLLRSQTPDQDQLWTGVIVSVFYGLFYLVSSRKIQLVHHPMIKVFGGITYPLYLSHELIGLLLIGIFLKYLPKQSVFVLVIVVMILFSYLVFKYEEWIMGFFKRRDKTTVNKPFIQNSIDIHPKAENI